MAITFAPRQWGIFMCDFGPNPVDPRLQPTKIGPLSVPPELWKSRRIIVCSALAVNHRHGRASGLCTVLPVSASQPTAASPYAIEIALGRYRSFTMDVWVQCEALQRVSHDRLDRVLSGRGYIATEVLFATDIEKVKNGIRAALDLH